MEAIRSRSSGFTIVELLIVVVIIAILAVITVVAYNGIQNRASDSAVYSDASSIAKKLAIIKVDLGRYPIIPTEFPADFKISKGAYSTGYNNMMYCVNKVTDRYALGMISKSTKGFLVVDGVIQVGVSPASIHATACTAIGATWANDANNAAIHGFSPVTGRWANTWPWVS
ncbi:prepilin-type N-terminal cleavage/methylation domain-containing protein [Candidatus Saccharibacteria bacterium]|nr:prepilin-type N-terminal cleavage/methylation domain-containing protein [Candidatus Saccharibacteria bacterium]